MSRRKLKTPSVPAGEKAYCGPFALMAVTGLSLAAARKHICRANGWQEGRRIAGLYESELVNAFRSAGIPINRYRLRSKDGGAIRWKRDFPTFTRWLNQRTGEEKRAMFLVALTGHYVMVNGNDFIDNHTRELVKLDDAPHRRARVRAVYKIG